jgi:hypothetical protein
MTKIAATVMTLVSLAGCASNHISSAIQYESSSARLYIEDSSGDHIKPLGGHLIDIDSVGIGQDAIRLEPGKHWITYVCPPGSDGIYFYHGITREFSFEAGKSYVLRCSDGRLSVTPRD